MTDSKKPTAGPESRWYDAMLTRRELAVRAAAVAAGATVFGAIGCSRPAEEAQEDATILSEFNALSLQRESRWDFGAEGQPIPQRDPVDADVANSESWRGFTTTAAMTQLFSVNNQLAGLQNNALIEVLDQPSASGTTLGDTLKPVHNEALEEAYHQGVGLANTIARSEKHNNTLVILDLEGAKSVAAAAGMASLFAPVLHLDNWPHPKGVVPSQDALGSMLYFAREFEDIATKRPADAAPVLVLDRDRLKDATIGPDTFDNRYGIGLPSHDDIKRAGIEQILYVVPNASVTQELDDLNEDFAVFAEVGLPVEMIALDEFQAASASSEEEREAVFAAAAAEGKEAPPVDTPEDAKTTATEYHEQRNYYYGGSPFGSFWFWMYMTSFRPPLFGGYHRPTTGTRPRAQAYKPTPRPTQFGTRYAGTRLNGGVGRQRPTGLGRVTAPVNARTGRIESGGYGAAAAAYAGSRSRVGVGGTPNRSSGTSSSGRGVYNTGG